MACLVLGATLGGVGAAVADANAEGVAVGSPGVLSGNVIQVPIHIPINVCGNSIGLVSLLNPSFGNTCVNS
nr:chaplin [Streptomyces sp. NBC_00974]